MSLSQEIHLLVQHPRITTLTTVANWQSGVATSGLAGADLFTYGNANRWWRLTEACFQLSVFNAAATVTVRGYSYLVGAMNLAFTDNWSVAFDGPIAWINFFFDIQLYGPIRVEVYSDQAADNGLVVPYDLRVKDW